MGSRYQVRLKNQGGSVVAIFDDWSFLSFSHEVNGPGTHRFVIRGDDDRIDLFELDGQLEIWRSDLANDIDWYLEKESFHRTQLRQTFENGRKHFTSFGRGYLDLLNRRHILYNAGNAYSSKSGAGETVIKAYVDENAGPSANDVNRLRNGVFAGLSIQADAANGTNWDGARAYANLLYSCAEIARETLVDFDVIGVGAALYEFRVYNGQRGSDRSTDGLDPATGLNGAGNVPVLFSLGYGNMGEPSYSSARVGEGNVVAVLGGGLEDDREVVIREDVSAVADSPWNDIEMTRQGGDQSTSELNSIGDEMLKKFQAEEAFSFAPLQVPSTLYGKDYFLGDLITGVYDDISRDKKILSVNISVDENGEKISIDIGDVLR